MYSTQAAQYAQPVNGMPYNGMRDRPDAVMQQQFMHGGYPPPHQMGPQQIMKQ
jgi:hypothetical protein